MLFKVMHVASVTGVGGGAKVGGRQGVILHPAGAETRLKAAVFAGWEAGGLLAALLAVPLEVPLEVPLVGLSAASALRSFSSKTGRGGGVLRWRRYQGSDE